MALGRQVALASLSLALAVAAACSSAETSSAPARGNSNDDDDDDDDDGDDVSGDDDDARPDSGPGEGDAGCTSKAPAPPVADGGFGCGTMDFGKIAAPFTGVDEDAGNTYDGGAFLPGIYDAVGAERLSASGGSWRETFVVDSNGRFTRVRQIDTGSGPGAVTRRSGTVTVKGSEATFTYDCAQSDGGFVEAGADTLPFEVVEKDCETRYRYGASGFRLTLVRR